MLAVQVPAAAADLARLKPGGALAGPVPAAVLRVIDGDTIEVRARIWIDQEIRTHVRIAGIDAPETEGACAHERALAQRARDWLTMVLRGGAVSLTNVDYGKYAGRVLADVADGQGRDVGAALIRAGLARPYDGGRRESWCGQVSGGLGSSSR